MQEGILAAKFSRILENLAENLVEYLWQLPSKGNAVGKAETSEGLRRLLIYAVRCGKFLRTHTHEFPGGKIRLHTFHVNIWSSEAADNCCPCAMPEKVPSNRDRDEWKSPGSWTTNQLRRNASINFYTFTSTFCYQLFACRRQRSQLKSIRLSVPFFCAHLFSDGDLWRSHFTFSLRSSKFLPLTLP